MFRCDRCCCFHVRGASYSAWCSGVIAAVVFTCVVLLILHDVPVWSLLLFSRAWCFLFCLMFRCDRCCCFHVRGASYSAWCSGVIAAVVFTCVVHLILADDPVWSLLLFSRAWCLLFCLMFRCDRCCCFHVRGASDSSWWSGVIVAVVFTCVVHLILADVPVWSLLLFSRAWCFLFCMMFRCGRCCCFHVRGASYSAWCSGVIAAVVFTCVVPLILLDVPVWSLLLFSRAWCIWF